MKKFEFYKIKDPSKRKIKKIAKSGKKQDYDGLVLLSPSNKFKELKDILTYNNFSIELIAGIEIYEKNLSNLKNLISKFRSRTNFLCIKGSSEEINKASLEDKRVDLLYNQVTPKKRGINHVFAKEAKKNSVALGINLSQILEKKGYLRTKLFRNLIKNKEIIKKYGTPCVLSTFSENKYQLKKERELKNLAKIIEFNESDIERSFKFINKTIEFNKKFKKEKFIQPGVEVVEDSSSDDEE